MAWREAASAVALALVALFALAQAVRLDVGSVTRPGPGFFPVVLAAALLITSVVLASGARRGRREGIAAPPSLRPPRPRALLVTVAAFAAYVALFEPVGFVLATTGFLAFLFSAVARYRWPLAVGIALGVALAARLLFDTWLQVRLPAGLLGR